VSADAPSFVPNIRLNCFTSVQFLLPEIGQTISNSIIKFLTSSKSSFSNELPNLDKIALIFSLYPIILELVVINCSLSKLSPNRFVAFLISLSIFPSILAQ